MDRKQTVGQSPSAASNVFENAEGKALLDVTAIERPTYPFITNNGLEYTVRSFKKNV